MTSMGVVEIRVGLLVFPQTLRSAIFGLIEFFETAGGMSERYPSPVRWVCEAYLDEPHPVALGVPSRRLLKRNARLDVVVVPPLSGPLEGDDVPAAALSWLVDQSKRGVVLCSSCVGAYVLASGGLLDGRRATTHWMLAQDFRSRFPSVDLVDEHIVVDEGDIITAGGVTAWLDLALLLCARFASPALAAAMGKYYLVDTGLREQRFYRLFLPSFSHGDDAILRLQRWLQREYTSRLTSEELARQAGMSERTLHRRFSEATGATPHRYLTRLRLSKACERLEVSRDPLEQICGDVGYDDPASFRKLFKREMGLSPAAYRRRFSGSNLR